MKFEANGIPEIPTKASISIASLDIGIYFVTLPAIETPAPKRILFRGILLATELGEREVIGEEVPNEFWGLSSEYRNVKQSHWFNPRYVTATKIKVDSIAFSAIR